MRNFCPVPCALILRYHVPELRSTRAPFLTPCPCPPLPQATRRTTTAMWPIFLPSFLYLSGKLRGEKPPKSAPKKRKCVGGPTTVPMLCMYDTLKTKTRTCARSFGKQCAAACDPRSHRQTLFPAPMVALAASCARPVATPLFCLFAVAPTSRFGRTRAPSVMRTTGRRSTLDPSIIKVSRSARLPPACLPACPPAFIFIFSWLWPVRCQQLHDDQKHAAPCSLLELLHPRNILIGCAASHGPFGKKFRRY